LELKQDWRKFHAVFHPGRRLGLSDYSKVQKKRTENAHLSPIVVVAERDQSGVLRCLMAYGDGLDLMEFVGATLSEIQDQHPNRILHALERGAVDQAMSRAITGSQIGETSFHDQVDSLRQAAVPVWSAGQLGANGERSSSFVSRSLFAKDAGSSPPSGERVSWDEYAQGHFLLEALKKAAGGSVFPRRFGLLIRLEGSLDQRASGWGSMSMGSESRFYRDFFVVLSQGRLDQFHAPDFTSIDAAFTHDLGYLARSLGEKYIIPVYGLSAPVELWNQWSSADAPWKELWRGLRSRKAEVSPESPALMLWLAWKRWTA